MHEMIINDGDYARFRERSNPKIPTPWTIQSIYNREGASSNLQPNKSINLRRSRLKAITQVHGNVLKRILLVSTQS